MTLTLNEATLTYTAEDGSNWKAIKNGRGDIKGFIEVFYSRHMRSFCTVPGASRFINL